MKLIGKRMRVLHIPQVPMKPFIVEVNNEREAFLIEKTLADQHLFLFDNNVIPDYSNAISVQYWEEELDADGEGSKWTDYWNEEEGMEWDLFIESFPEYLNGMKS